MVATAYRDCEAQGGSTPIWSLRNYEDELVSAESRRFELRATSGEIEALVFYRAIDREAWIVHLAVRNKGCGEGSRLLSAFIAKTREEGFATVALEVSSANARARALYAKQGFTEIGLRKAYYRDGSDALVLRRGT